MRFSAAFVALAVPYLVKAAPVRRDDPSVLVMQFADVLEQLESSFYETALQKFQSTDFIAAGYADANVPIQQFTAIQVDEASHSTVLQAAIRALGGEPITTCQFNFDSALTDVATMAATARVIEQVGVTAYGGGTTLLTNTRILAAAAGILTVEARHQTILNLLSGQGTAIPSAFDISLRPQEVLAMVVPFIDPSSPCDLGIQPNPTLSITNTGSVGPGTSLTFQSSAINSSTDGLFCQMLVGGAVASISLPFNQCVVPPNINGPVAIWITSDDQPLLSSVEDRATSQLVAGPTIAFIDTQPQAIGSVVRSGSSGSSDSSSTVSTETRTISPEEASSIIAGASPTATPAATDAPSASSITDSSAPAPTDGSTSSNGDASSAPTSGGPNQQTGPNADNSITVIGWTTVPAAGN